MSAKLTKNIPFPQLLRQSGESTPANHKPQPPASQGWRLRNAAYLKAKRWFDLLLILACLPIVLPLFAIAGCWVMAVSRGPVFFRQQRVGKDGKVFTLYKFRSMGADAPQAPHRDHVRALVKSQRPMIKLDQLGDSRFIPGGRFLRSSGIDELPQLLNVLSGDMSLVGPRPCLPYECEFFSARQYARFRVAPGLTGLWQVKGRNEATFREMSAMDLYYSRRASFWFDLVLLSRTPAAVSRQVMGDFRESRRNALASRRTSRSAAPSAGLLLRAAKSE